MTRANDAAADELAGIIEHLPSAHFFQIGFRMEDAATLEREKTFLQEGQEIRRHWV
jgi:hypothetical protein